MRKQQEVWELEHKKSQTLPTLAQEEPASGVVDFVRTLHISPPGKIVDIGCGKGRNALYLAKLNFEVYAMDYIQRALDITKEKAKRLDVLDNLHLIQANIDTTWPFDDNFFDTAIDSFSSIDIETKKGREIYRDEMYRTLKPGGTALVTVVSNEDEWEKQLIASSPGNEPNSTIWPQNGKFQKDYSENELKDFYKRFRIVSLRKIKKKAFKLGKNYTATNFWLVLKK